MRKVRPPLAPAPLLAPRPAVPRSPARERGDCSAARRPIFAPPVATLALLLSLAVGLLAGCATAGPLHVYSIASSPSGQPRTSATRVAIIRDVGPDSATEVPSFVHPDETVTGFAYDPYTDHFFLRLAPGNRFRVIDRPAHAIKREFTVAALEPSAGGDLAIRPRDGHVFALQPTGRAVAEITRYGEFVRAIPLEGLRTAPAGLAYDPTQERLFVLSGSAPTEITSHTLDGKLGDRIPIASPIAPSSLGYDPGKQEFYVPLADGGAVGVFNAKGQLVRTIPGRAAFVDVGPRSFVRVF